MEIAIKRHAAAKGLLSPGCRMCIIEYVSLAVAGMVPARQSPT